MRAEELSEPELAVWEAFPAGEAVDLRDVGDSVVRAEALTALLLGERSSQPGRVPARRRDPPDRAAVAGPTCWTTGSCSAELWHVCQQRAMLAGKAKCAN